MAEILVVEDDATMRHMLRRILEAEGLEVVLAGSSQDALQEMQDREFDLIVTDYDLRSEHTGLSLMEYVRRKTRRPPVILISGKLNRDLEKKARALGAFSVFRKPFSIESFVKACQDAIQ